MLVHVAVGVLLAGLVGCGSGSASDAGGTPSDPSSRPGPYLTEVSAIRVGADGRSLVVTAAKLPVAGSTGDCQVTVGHTVEQEADRLYVVLTVTSRVEGPDPDYPDCRTAPRPVTVDVGGPVDGRAVMTQAPRARWNAGPDGRYRICSLPACDPDTGSVPAPVTCDDGSLAEAVRAGDVPAHAGLGQSACELPWAVIDVDVGAGACPATGDGTNPCAGRTVHRTYWKADGPTWTALGQSTGSGCGDAAELLPGFPQRLCQGLGALPGS